MYKKEIWPNGLRTIYIPMKNTKTVAVLVLVSTGSRYETKEINGISHFLEHMAFKGTVKRPSKVKIAQELDGIGAEYNAFTSKEFTGYWVKTSSKHLKLAVDVVSDIFLNSTIPAEEIEKERGVIIGEIDMNEDIPMSKVGDLFEELLYGDQPVGWTITGRKANIRSIKREDFITYRDKQYRSRNTVIVVAGNINLKKTRSLVKKYFTDIKSGRATRPLPVKERQARPKIKILNKKTDQNHLVLGVRTFDLFDKRRWPLTLLTVVLGGNMSSRLFIRIRDELGLGYYIGASNSLATDHGYFDVSTGVQTKKTSEALEAIIEELKRVKKDGILEDELKKAKEYIRGHTLISLESADEFASYYGMQAILNQKILTPEQKLRMLEKVQVSDVKKVAREIFKTRNLNLALVGQIEERGRLERLLKF